MRPGVHIIIPSLGRPDRLGPLCENLAETTPEALYDLTFVLDNRITDPASWDALRPPTPGGISYRVITCDGTYPHKINAGYRPGPREWSMPTADDVEFNDGWLEAALDVPKTAHVIGTDDLSPMSNPWHSTMPIIRNSYIENPGCSWNDPGVIFHEGYHHNFCETEICELARYREVWHFVPTSMVEHHHPSWEKRKPDDTDRKGWMRHQDRDSALFHQRRPAWS